MPGAGFAKNSIVIDGFSLTRLLQLPVIRHIWGLTVLYCIRVPFSCFHGPEVRLFFWDSIKLFIQYPLWSKHGHIVLRHRSSVSLWSLYELLQSWVRLNNWLMFSEQNFLFLYRTWMQQQCDDSAAWPHLVKWSPTKASCCLNKSKHAISLGDLWKIKQKFYNWSLCKR